ncbi:NUDIX domain-containing protein [Paenibacillus sp. N1-5-1-14]|uniref:NUDIX domain-containing protein n=1 Tax=Paenibacillus radicibacter TaxID=2972488 RepID=UPI00215972C1|nr:NUDIX domain-containing protein [Paenibacillus radicibacter]MCR8644390.1 NUDIX domain-containing protein [Paenibacillus radicibacter]
MSFPIRVRPTALIIENDAVLLVEYDNLEKGKHYFLPGGGAEEGEVVKETVRRELLEEAMAEVIVGSVAFLCECEQQQRNIKYSPRAHTLFIVFECQLISGSVPRLPLNPDINQTAVKWVPLDELHTINLMPDMLESILTFASEKKSVVMIEDHRVRV